MARKVASRDDLKRSQLSKEPRYRRLGPLGRGLMAAALCLDVGPPEPSVLTQDRVEAGRGSLIEHVQNVKRDYVVNWHHDQLATALEKVQAGIIKRLLVLMPPRHGKSELVSRHFPAWCLGKDPNEKIVACGYSQDIASKESIAVQRIMHHPAYLDEFQTKLAATAQDRTPTKTAERQDFFEVANGGSGSYVAAGVRGPITGKGFTLGIVDDPIKNREDAESKLKRDRVWEWWVSTFLTRGEGAMSRGGEERIVVCLTPWHEDDLAGRILQNAKITGEEWVVIRFPAVYEESSNDNIYNSTPEYSHDPREIGQALWPAKFDEAKLSKIEKTNAREWNSLYQCRPAPDKGNIFQASWWKWYESEEDLPKADTYCFTLDAAFKDLETSSYVVLQLWMIQGPNRYLIDQWRGHWDFPNTLDICRAAFKKYPNVVTKLIEEKANGAALIATMKSQFPGMIPINPKGSKVSRARAVQDYVRGGNVYLPRHNPASQNLVEEAKSFPFGSNDDQVDAMVQMLLHYLGSENAVNTFEKMISSWES